jgi:hypothetical protein
MAWATAAQRLNNEAEREEKATLFGSIHPVNYFCAPALNGAKPSFLEMLYR